MKSHYRVVVIGGGIVGASVLYHLAKFGWADIALIERAELTCGSTWHAAGGFHALNDDPNIAALQGYTIRLYAEIERESGVSVGMHMTGGISLAASPERMQMLKAERAMYEAMAIETRLVTPDEIRELCPIVDVSNLRGGLYDAHEGYMDPHGTTHAYAGAAKKRGADVILRNRVVELRQLPDSRWSVVTEAGTITADHIVNAAGLWARKVGNMAGINLPVTPMQHHYLITDDVPELAALDREIVSITDLEGFTYLQPERKGVLLGIYERNPRHWQVEGAEWHFGMDLLPPDVDRILPELSIGFERFPALQNVGIRRWVNGAFTFTPDGNPLVGPAPGRKNYWVACGCMGGFSQGGAIGLTLAQWMINGDPGADIFGMDVARYGAFAAGDAYLKDTTRQFYARRFVISYPNEELPAGRPLKVSPCYDALEAEGAVYGCNWGMETPLFFAPGQTNFAERLTMRRSNAHDLVAAEVIATREAAGMFESAVRARYEVSGPGAARWLDWLLASHLPPVGRVRLAPMLSPNGKLMGDLAVNRFADDRFWLLGPYYLQAWHLRWFDDHLPAAGVALRNLSDQWMGFAMSGPASRDIISRLTDRDMSNSAFPFQHCAQMRIAGTDALVARLSATGELGYEINVPVSHQFALYEALKAAGKDCGLRSIGNRALDSLRLEKSYGIWNAEFSQSSTPGMCNLVRHVALDKADFIGRDAAVRERDAVCDKLLVTLHIDAADADASGFEPVRCDGRLVGCVTSGAYGHYVRQSLALAYVERAVAVASQDLVVDVIGEPRAARILRDPAYDPKGLRLRS